MNSLLFIMTCLLGGFLSLALAYLFCWVAIYFLRPHKSIVQESTVKTRFAFVVPAHNEAEGIRETLTSLSHVTYPRHLFDVVVVADNCTDQTARIAREAGAVVLERQSETEKGKGYALRFAFQSLLSKDFDAFIVIDADSVVDDNYLFVLDSCLASGHEVIQTVCSISNPEESSLTYLFYIGNILENNLFYAGKAQAGVPAILRGDGMCFSRSILSTIPWDAFSVVEDTEYTIRLIRQRIHIAFAPETRVLARQPENLDQAHTQRVRWASGNMKMTKGFALRLILEGFRNSNLFLADTGVSLLVLSKPLLLLHNLCMLLVACIYASFSDSGSILMYWSFFLLAVQCLYIGTGVVLGGMDRRKLQFLIRAPLYLGWMVVVIVMGMAGYRADSWVRTKRS